MRELIFLANVEYGRGIGYSGFSTGPCTRTSAFRFSFFFNPVRSDPERTVKSWLDQNICSSEMMKPLSNYFKAQSKKVYALMQDVEDEKYRERVVKEKELDTLDAEYVVDSIKHAGAIAIAEYEDVIEKRSSN